jgi:nitrate/TMAO reductase-like tetraheme cytochrome c subunit
MSEFQGEVIRDAQGREVVRITTSSGVRAVIATCIPAAALDKMARKLERKIARRKASRATGHRTD